MGNQQEDRGEDSEGRTASVLLQTELDLRLRRVVIQAEVKTMKKRMQYTGEEKVAILRKHLLGGVSVADICDEYGIRPTVFYRWQKQFFERGVEVFRRGEGAETKKLQRRVEY